MPALLHLGTRRLCLDRHLYSAFSVSCIGGSLVGVFYVPNRCTYKAGRHVQHRHIIRLCPGPRHCSCGRRKRTDVHAISLYNPLDIVRLRWFCKCVVVSIAGRDLIVCIIQTHPYRAPGCVRYGKTILLTFSSDAISVPSSPS